MIATRLQLYCDGTHHSATPPPHFPEHGAIDGAIYTPADLRKEAKKAGWKRTIGHNNRDLCPDCARKEKR